MRVIVIPNANYHWECIHCDKKFMAGDQAWYHHESLTGHRVDVFKGEYIDETRESI